MSKSTFFALFSAMLLAFACKREVPLPPRLQNFSIIPSGRVGPITMDSCRQEVVLQLYGTHAKTNLFDVPNGASGEGITLFPEDSTRRMDIWYLKTYSPDFPAMFRVRGGHSVWKTNKGITLGMPISEVEKINEKPFKIGPNGKPGQLSITNWNGGQLNDALGLTFLIQGAMPTTEISSDDPALLALNPTVWAMTTYFRKPIEVKALPVQTTPSK